MGKNRAIPHLKTVSVQQDLETQLEAAKKAQADKLVQSKKHLQSQLKMAAEKYLTVNGYMQVRTTMQQVPLGLKEAEPENGFNTVASEIASEMSKLAAVLAARLEKLDVTDLDETFLEGHLEKDFVNTRRDPLLEDVVKQLLIVNLLQNVGPVVDDIVSFRASTDAAIAAIETELELRSRPAAELDSIPVAPADSDVQPA